MNEDQHQPPVDDPMADAHQEVARSTEEPDEGARQQGASAGERLAGTIEAAAKTVRQIDPSALADGGAEAVQQLREHGEELAQQAADQAGKRADTATRAAGGRLIAAAGYLREQETHLGSRAEALDQVAGSLEHSGVYLQEQGVAGIRSKVLDVIRKHPVLSLLGACGLGYLLGRVARGA
jgi:hypothetical protein